jgi:hypothetical protein
MMNTAKRKTNKTKQHSVFFSNPNYKYMMIIYTLNDLLFSLKKIIGIIVIHV